ncbi:MAG: hypothetical protein ACR2N7_05140 [Acidimicrobiia bacterium]
MSHHTNSTSDTIRDHYYKMQRRYDLALKQPTRSHPAPRTQAHGKTASDRHGRHRAAIVAYYAEHSSVLTEPRDLGDFDLYY